MDNVIDFREIADAIKVLKEGKKGYITNFYIDMEKVDEWIKSETLQIQKYNHSLFLLKKNEGFTNLYFCTTSYEYLKQSLSELKNEIRESLIVVDLIGRMSDMTLLGEVFRNNDFYDYIILNRMSKNTTIVSPCKQNLYLKIASIEQVDDILNLFHTYFDPISEQLPTYKELVDWIRQEHISLYEVDGKIAGFIIYDLNGQTSYLRYWFVHPEYRNKKIGSILLNKFFSDNQEAKRQLFWVIQSNENAIKRYKHYGFESENLYDFIMTNKNIQYEAESN